MEVTKTNPLVSDSDGDRISDGGEIKVGLNPLNKYTNAGVLDTEYVMTQTLDETQFTDFNKDNSYSISAVVKAAGYAGTALMVEESGFRDMLSDNDAVVGNIFSFRYNSLFKMEQVVLKFRIDETILNETLVNYPDDAGLKGIKRYQIFHFDKNSGAMYPLETEFEEQTNTLSVTTKEEGDYCVIDLDQLLYSMGAGLGKKVSTPKVSSERSTEKQMKVSSIGAEDKQVEDDILPDNYNEIVQQKINKICGVFKKNKGQNQSQVKKKPADIVYILDTSKSMEDEIQRCKNGMENLVMSLYEEGIDARITVLSFDDKKNEIKEYRLKTKKTWGTNAASAKVLIDQVNVTNGKYENHMDALEKALKLSYRKGAIRFAFLITDEPLNTQDNQTKNTVAQLAQKLDKKKLVTSVICKNGDMSTFSSIFEKTGGVQMSVSSDFDGLIHTFVYTYLMNDNTFWVNTPGNLTFKVLSAVPKKDCKVDTDKDKLTDAQEIDWRLIETGKNKLELPMLKEYWDSLSKQDKEVFQRITEKKREILYSFIVLPIYSDPTSKDTDEDKVNDNLDATPMFQNEKIIYLFYERGIEDFLEFEARCRQKEEEDNGCKNVRLVATQGKDEFKNAWNKMGVNWEGKISYEIEEVHLIYHGSYNVISIGHDKDKNSSYLLISSNSSEHIMVKNLDKKKIGYLNLSSCNNGNLDYVDSNMANEFMKNFPDIDYVTAWDGSAVYSAAIIKYTNPFTIINKGNMDLMEGEEYSVLIAKEYSTATKDFNDWSIVKNGCKREPMQNVKYTRDKDGNIKTDKKIKLSK